MELQVIASEVKLVQRVGELNDVDKKSFGERYSDLARLKNIN